MPRNSSGTFTLVAGNPVLPSTLIESNWANTTLTDIAQALTDSLSRNGSGGMLVPFEFADGTKGAPAITWANQPNSGIYRAGLNDMRVSMTATDISRWNGANLQVADPAGSDVWQNVAHSSAAFGNAQTVLLNSFNYLAPVVAEGTMVLFGTDGRTNASAEAAMKLGDSSVQPTDNVSVLTNDAGYLTEVPPASGSDFGGFKYVLDGTTLNLFITTAPPP